MCAPKAPSASAARSLPSPSRRRDPLRSVLAVAQPPEAGHYGRPNSTSRIRATPSSEVMTTITASL
jgi:hypothetical protein